MTRSKRWTGLGSPAQHRQLGECFRPGWVSTVQADGWKARFGWPAGHRGSTRVGAAGSGVQPLPHARAPLLGAALAVGAARPVASRAPKEGEGIREVEGRAKDGTGGCGGRARREQWRASDRSSPPPRASIYLYRGHPLPGTPAAYVTERYHQRDRPTDRPPAEAAGCRGRRTSTSTSCARSRATTSPPPPSSATTAPSGLRAPPSRR